MNYNIEEIDLSLAIQLQAQFEEELRVQRIKDEEKQKSLEIVGHKWDAKWMSLPEPEQEKLSVSLVDPCWEYLDPNPNIYDLFLTFNHQFFWGRLMGVEVKWSPRMTLCAGVCSYEGRGGLCSVRLSTPLLKLRPRKDLIETLLHEMIHAYLFVTHNNTDHDGHGPQFHTHMYRINKLAGTNISVYHSFHDEVNVYRQHIWQCDGPCRKRPPYYGLVKRSMNRPPAPRDLWWEQHARSCGGTYTKIKEPEGYGQPKSKRKIKDESAKDIRSYFKTSENKKAKTSSEKENKDAFKFPASSKHESRKVGSDPANQNVASGFKRLDIANASNSSVHGFGSGIPQKSSGSGSTKGSTKGSSSSGTAMRNSGGSKTIVVNKKGKKQQKDSKNEERNVSQPNQTFDSFSGRGYTLGTGSSSGRSRLLAQFDQLLKKSNSSETKQDLSCRGNTEDDSFGDYTLCPLCQVRINSNDFENHVALCLGDIDFNSDIESNTNTDSDSPVAVNGLRNGGSNSEEYIEISDDENIPSSLGERSFPCPVCNEKFKECDIDAHVNGHFS